MRGLILNLIYSSFFFFTNNIKISWIMADTIYLQILLMEWKFIDKKMKKKKKLCFIINTDLSKKLWMI